MKPSTFILPSVVTFFATLSLGPIGLILAAVWYSALIARLRIMEVSIIFFMMLGMVCLMLTEMPNHENLVYRNQECLLAFIIPLLNFYRVHRKLPTP